jgi:SAM-dependent methyltransferase
VDISEAAIELARGRVPDAELRVAPVRELPFEAASFDLVVMNDVLQHVAEAELEQSLAELKRVLAPEGALFLRTNGARRARRERADWRAYDRATLASTLEQAGFSCERLTYANMLLSLWGVARGRVPRAPSEHRDGIASPAGRLTNALGYRILLAEARYLSRPSRALPYGHTLLALASSKRSRARATASAS